MRNGGYDIVDHRDIDAMFGDLDDAEDLIADAHRHGLRVVAELVPNHCSTEHPWFRAALVASPDSAERRRFWFRAGPGPHGDAPPNDWQSVLGGPAWTRVTEPDGSQGQWYRHTFGASQPDFNWSHPAVRAEFEEILRFWLDRGVDGVHVDAADRLGRNPPAADPLDECDDGHEVFRSWRRIVDSYPGERALTGDIRLADPRQSARYLRTGELHSATTIDFLCSPWCAELFRDVIDESLGWHTRLGAPPTWMLANHAVTRLVTRYGRGGGTTPVDLAAGTRRARAAILLAMALPGVVHIYQGEELGLWEVEDLPRATPADPTWRRSELIDRASDGCRVPMPWETDEAAFGFSPAGAPGRPWLPQPAEWGELSARRQLGDRHSMLRLYRRALRIRRAELANASHDLTWLPAPAGALAFARQRDFVCVVNFSASALPLPAHDAVLLASADVGGRLPAECAAWLRGVDTHVAAEWPLAG